MHARKLIGILALAGLSVIVGGSVAKVQESGSRSSHDRNQLAQASQTTAKSSRESKVAGQAAPMPETRAAAPVWKSRCASATRQSVPECVVEQTAVLDKTGQMIANISVRLPPTTGEPVMMVHVPVGLFLPAGISVQIDEQAPMQLVVQTCDLKGCYAGSQISPAMLGAMKAGKRLAIGFQNISKQTITVPLTLAQFADSYQRIQ